MTVRRSAPDIQPMTGAACVICTIVFLMLNSGAANDWASASRWGYYPDLAVFQGKWWALITSAFVHIDLLHLAFNMYWLWHLGSALERTFGSLRWLLFVFCAAFVSSSAELATGSMGIGMSGVGYALFGFGWLGRHRYAEFAKLVTRDTAKLFIVWGLICFVGTQAGFMHIANAAHLGGLVFGVVVGGALAYPKWQIPAALGLALLGGLAIVPIRWNPLSVDWVSLQATKAHREHRVEDAVGFYRRVIDMDKDGGEDTKWAWLNLAGIYGALGEKENYREAIRRLNELESEDVDEITARYGVPSK